jgi:ubiquinone/menaquinone biosynthesis C-methylase UbiE
MKENDPVTTYFDKLPETHKRQFEERASGANFNFQQRLTLACELGGGSSGRLLDCAAGTGEITCALLKSGKFSHAPVVDVSPAMLQSAKDLLTSQIKNVELEFVQSDVFNFKPSDSRFDLILCLGLIAHTGRLDILLPHLRSMLTPGGRIILPATLTDHLGTRIVQALTSRSELARADSGFPGSANKTSPTRATAPGCGFWRRGGTVSVFHSAIACGHGRIFNWKLG